MDYHYYKQFGKNCSVSLAVVEARTNSSPFGDRARDIT